MPRRHLHTYPRLKPKDNATAHLEPALDQSESAPGDERPHRELPPTDYRPVVAVIAIVIFSLALIAFLLTLGAMR